MHGNEQQSQPQGVDGLWIFPELFILKHILMSLFRVYHILEFHIPLEKNLVYELHLYVKSISIKHGKMVRWYTYEKVDHAR